MQKSASNSFVVNMGLKIGCTVWGRKPEMHCWRPMTGLMSFFPTHYPWETMGIVQLEAMAHGLPVIASDWQGPKDVVLDEDTGFLRPHNRPDLFAECLKRLARDAVLRNRLGRAGLERYRSMYTEAAFIGRFVEELSHLKG